MMTSTEIQQYFRESVNPVQKIFLSQKQIDSIPEIENSNPLFGLPVIINRYLPENCFGFERKDDFLLCNTETGKIFTFPKVKLNFEFANK